ncbi:MAG TPA: phosphatase PAP2 family protein [Coxiellaceae bacterium]|nr:phosphatase PAP2 family protein [Coxiellaceae bacterium]
MKAYTSNDTVFLLCSALLLLLDGLLFAWNNTHQRFYLDFAAIGGAPWGIFTTLFFFALFFVAIKLSYRLPSFSLCLKAMVMLLITLTLTEISNAAVLTTPFPTHDMLINHIDQRIGFHLLIILQLLKQHDFIEKIIWGIYYSLLLAMHVTPITLSLIATPRVLYHYFTSFLLSAIIGYSIFYFFPTDTSPASIYPHRYFTDFQLNTLHQFQLEHLHHTLNFNLVGGVISFPSFHAIWITLIVFFLWPFRFIKIPALIYGIAVLLTTVLTGWHYLMDSIAGIVIAYAAIQLAGYAFSQNAKAQLI